MARTKGSKNKVKALMVENVSADKKLTAKVISESRIRSHKKEKMKAKYPKAMTIRYDETQEKEIVVMMDCLKENTMSKAFLKTPTALRQQSAVIEAQNKEMVKLREKLFKLESMAASFNEFNKKLEEFMKVKR